MGDRVGKCAGAASGIRIVAAAREAVGARFRLHGRDPATGLDCVGLAAWALRAGGFRGAVPDGYAMRGGDPRAVSELLDASGLVRVVEGAPGDLLLCGSGPGQLHLAIVSESGVIHADAMLRRVVERPGTVPWPVIGVWRLVAGDGGAAVLAKGPLHRPAAGPPPRAGED